MVLVLFIDSVNRVYRVQIEQSAAASGEYVCFPCVMTLPIRLLTSFPHSKIVLGGSERLEVQARKFYSQRNMYLCGFTLFLSLILNRTYMMILDVLRLEEKVKRYEGDPSAKGKDSARLGNAGGAGEIASLRRELEQKTRDLETMKKQSEGLHREYGNLSDKYTNLEGRDSLPRKDL